MQHRVRLLAALCLALALPGLATAQDYTKWYLAEGSTGFFEEEILIANPNATAATVSIQYIVPAGSPTPALKTITVEATSRATVRVKDDIDIHAVSALVTSNLPIVVERSMYWGGPARLGGHNATGVMTPQMEWFLAEGVSSAIFDEFILLANPNDGPVEIQIDYLGTDGIRDVDTYTVAANSRRTIHAAVDLEARFAGRFRNRTFSARVKSLTDGRPIIVERAIYWGGIFAAGLNPGGTAEAGISTLSDTWRFGEGFTASGFQTFVLVANPNPEEATIDTTFFLEDGTTAVDTRTLPPNSRTNIWVNAEVGRANNQPFSILVKAHNGAKVAAERAMYWGGLREGHVVAGIPNEVRNWGFAEGLEDRFGGVEYDTYFLLGNSGESPVNVKATFMLEDGTGLVENFTINARSRYTLIAARHKELSNRRFAAFFEASGPIVAERAVYWGQGYYGGHASAGVALPDTFAAATPKAITGPTVASISPAFGPTNGGTNVTINGTNFGMDATVTIGGVNATRQVIDAQTIIARTPGGTVGAKPVVVTSVGKSATSPTDFTYETPPPPPPPPTSGTQARGAPVATYCTAFASNGVCTRVQTFPFPLDFFGLIRDLALARGDLLRNSCHETGGNNQFMFEAVRRLRQATGSNRWGLNIKRGNQGLSQDIVTYFYGPEGTEMEGDIRVYIFDIISGHCGPNPGPNWADVTDATRSGGTIGRWTTAGQNF
jgi:hypothetical protein